MKEARTEKRGRDENSREESREVARGIAKVAETVITVESSRDVDSEDALSRDSPRANASGERT